MFQTLISYIRNFLNMRWRVPRQDRGLELPERFDGSLAHVIIAVLEPPRDGLGVRRQDRGPRPYALFPRRSNKGR